MTIAEFRALRKRAGVCRDCGKEDAYTMGGRTFCFECAEKLRIAKQEMRKDPEKYARARAQHKAMQDRRKANGQCPLCGRKVTGRFVCCDWCRAKRRNYERAYRNNPPRGEYGTCWQCNKRQVIPGKRLCQECYDMKLRCLQLANKANQERKLKARSESQNLVRFLPPRAK